MSGTDILPLTDTVAPADAAEVAEVVRNAACDRAPVYPIGGGTALDYGGRPSVLGTGLSLANLNRVIDYPADDMTITVEAGLRVAELADRLQAKGQWLPIDMPQPGQATIGGVVAANPSGPRRYAYGTMRDYLLGISTIDGTGMAFAAGGRVVKNAAGYDLCKLMIGSLGTLGVITQVTLMVRPLPESSALLVGEVADFGTAERLLAELVHTQTLPAAVELLAGRGQPPGGVLGPMLAASTARLIVGFEGSRADVDWMIGQLGKEWAESGVSGAIAITGNDVPVAWRWLGELPTDVQICLRPSGVVAMVEHLLHRHPEFTVQAHAGNGVIRVGWPASPPPPTEVLCGELRAEVAEAGGTLAVLRHPGGNGLSAREVWGPPGGAAPVMRAIKDRFDPHNILNPGRLSFD